MIIRGCSMMLVALGVGLFFISKINPFFAYIYMDWVGLFAIIGGILILMIAFPFSDTGLLYDTLPAGACFMPFIRRDGTIAPVTGKRVFPGESFLEVKGAGIVEDLGVDTVLSWGRKRIRFVIENLNYTPDPRFGNVCEELYRIGFDDKQDLEEILYNLPKMDPMRDRIKKAYYLDRMGDIYWRMTHSPARGGERFVKELRNIQPRNDTFGRRRHQRPTIEDRIVSQPVSEAPQQRQRILYSRPHDQPPATTQTTQTPTEDLERLKKLIGESD